MRFFFKPALALALFSLIGFGCVKESSDLVSSDTVATTYDQLDALFTEYEVVTIDNQGLLDHSAANKESNFILNLGIASKPNWSFDVQYHEFYTPDFKSYASAADGSWVEVPNGDERNDAFYGTTPNDEDVHGMFIMMDDNLEAEIYDGDVQYGLVPLQQYVAAAQANQYLLHRLDADIAGNNAHCGNDDAEIEDYKGEEGSTGGMDKMTCREMSVGYVADWEMYRFKFNSSWTNTRNYCENRLKFGSYRYWGYNQYPLYVKLNRRYIRTNTSNRPLTSSDKATAVTQFFNWSNNTNNMGYSDEQICFTGRDFGGLFGRVHQIGAVCRRSGGKYVARAMVTKINGVSNAVYSKVTGHEIGHTLGAYHKDSGFMKQGSHSNQGMPSATRNELNGYINNNNGCLSNRTCANYRGL